MPPKQKIKPRTRYLCFDGMSPQQAIRHLKNLITHTPEPYKRFLRIEEYRERLGDPYSDGEKEMRLVCYAND